VKLAVIHYQFEAIHPFSDGNGRTGRILNSLFLMQRGLLDLPVLYLSKYIIQHKRDYYRLLRAVTEKQQWKPFKSLQPKKKEKKFFMSTPGYTPCSQNNVSMVSTRCKNMSIKL
jgi:hypothetical protein